MQDSPEVAAALKICEVREAALRCEIAALEAVVRLLCALCAVLATSFVLTALLVSWRVP